MDFNAIIVDLDQRWKDALAQKVQHEKEVQRLSEEMLKLEGRYDMVVALQQMSVEEAAKQEEQEE